MTFLFWLSFIALVVAVASSVELMLGAGKLRHLRDVRPDETATPLPPVSIVFSALNEAHTIEPALRSVLALDYPALEIIVINDRSTDATPAILERMASGEPRLKVVHVDTLPEGWLGKNHALHRGSQAASGDYLLFTDADVVFERTTLRRAVAHCLEERLDHLTVFPDTPVKDRLLAMLMLNFGVTFMLRFKPWKVRDSAGHFLGLGAFNLVKTSAYRDAGGHAAIAMQVLDDLMLGRVMKEKGCRQDVMLGTGLVSVAWYHSAAEMFRGMEKNLFAGFDYRLSLLGAATVLVLLIRVWPWAGLVVTHGSAWWMNLATVLLEFGVFLASARLAGYPLGALLYLPVVNLISLAMWWRASLLTLSRGGITWRGTFYSLGQLRRRS
ncbi:Glycosyltransferase, catalytic subunit of cellulose synthase and poly-beta-1,6-N-acetylglucosamine synthase [Noviherbaspirillum humi]|uniref:Glycosyltransferase, catalytic subunit of cellulose synthase and poly-beta-1,6-N-acetylglucosamine synthase n=1 Tax=Noviherbaspirillum humi TaxID=1688639 RepID=A0A239K150_9BURK|nr:glycosyltransferase [Noviherbaspirillum humi]SNT11745.1 Glycosyltransferase, catalytic subunit of cellulose synthase and poly-beta-1,6-N-acetylglucosamine synthase [Noviherbaspirillum humi]